MSFLDLLILLLLFAWLGGWYLGAGSFVYLLLVVAILVLVVRLVSGRSPLP